MARTVAIGIQDFRDVIERKYFYIALCVRIVVSEAK